ncbi:ubiquinone anaerobic biosynthesis protein UbiU [Solemya velum gill symbiont]|uniref:ubiquinone anaerobic biosynthesis protein UbiU n=1 Tax=Solemya velum gill symbiont TaxID=2340 RepID=UPI00099735EC|nr:peptidase U32 family protein [Solemya velum gill symbiont]OOY50069.1 protease [Solemya velum gill symbiont]OOY54334.1 protease [Solemya velum gill symbiont]OOY54674.1 protease [Solemya velum gill symbiont]OOY59066.1 protease [Solemya velum gill symbiont]OOY62587.1 protease [Solemya velum gill symbiont]
MELVCPAGNLPSLKVAVDHGADAVYMGFLDDTNARHFAGLNFNDKRARDGIRYAQERGTRVFLAINTYPQPAGWPRWEEAVDKAANLGIDALICADIGVMQYACDHAPQLNLHLSVQGSATSAEAVSFYHDHFGIKRAVLPRVLSLKQLRRVVSASPVPIEVFGFGSLCVMVEGRCLLSSYVTGQSPNTYGACSPASAVRWDKTPRGLESRLNEVLIDRYADGENAGYPTLCKGRFHVHGKTGYAIEEPVSLNTMELLPELLAMGVAAIKIEGRQRSPVYVEQVATVWRAAIDACQKNPSGFHPDPAWQQVLQSVSEGAQTTFGAYHRPWQ